MENPSEAEEIRQFFDKQQQTREYETLKSMTRALDMLAARSLNSSIRGHTLSVGGIWDYFEWGDRLKNLTVLDLSPEMLKKYTPGGAKGIVGDFYDYDFGVQKFDCIVFPLMLHHTPRGNWQSCLARIVEAIQRARDLLRHNGQITIVEYCPHPLWMVDQRVALPVTRRFLDLFGQPLVAMYSRTFYEQTLTDELGSCETIPIDPEGFNYWKWYPVFMSIRWLRVPLKVYPKLHIFNAPAGNRTHEDLHVATA